VFWGEAGGVASGEPVAFWVFGLCWLVGVFFQPPLQNTLVHPLTGPDHKTEFFSI
jgi:hypothetical protein